MNRDAALSYSGKYQFTVTADDPLENSQTFQSNEMQIAVYAPTPAPATPTPPPVPTAEPTFVPATVIPIRDPSIGTVPKAIQNVLLPLLIIAGVVLLAVCVLLLIATNVVPTRSALPTRPTTIWSVQSAVITSPRRKVKKRTSLRKKTRSGRRKKRRSVRKNRKLRWRTVAWWASPVTKRLIGNCLI